MRVAATMLAATMFTLGLTVAANVTTATPAHALCATPVRDGIWYNIDSASRGVVRVEISSFCSDVVICDAATGICSRPPSYEKIRVFGSCVPTACDWGGRYTTTLSDGFIQAWYHHSWAVKEVRARAEVWYGQTYLRLWTRTDFTDGRTDYESTEWFLK
jgi:hypothetical protein